MILLHYFFTSKILVTRLGTDPELVDSLIMISWLCELHRDLHDVTLLISHDHVPGLPGVSANVTCVILCHEASVLIIILMTLSDEALSKSQVLILSRTNIFSPPHRKS